MEHGTALLEYGPKGEYLKTTTDIAFKAIVAFEEFENDPSLAFWDSQKPFLNPTLDQETVPVSGTSLEVSEPMSNADRLLTEVDHFVRDIEEYGYILPETRLAVRQNLTTAIQEQAMPYAVTETRHEAEYDYERKERIFMWMGRTAVENAQSGYVYHRHEAAHKRVDIEVDEARHASTLEIGRARVFISPRMTSKDASYEVAKDEHLHADDAVRVSWLIAENGKTERVMQSLLVKDIPLDAWVTMLEDSHNIFGKSIKLSDKESSLAVMEVHRALELPVERLSHGPVSIIEAVMPYIADEVLRNKISSNILKYHQDQAELTRQAELKAEEWEAFELELAASLAGAEATGAIVDFIHSMDKAWSEEDRAIINRHTANDVIWMSRELAAVVESAKQLLLSARAAILADEEHVLSQVKSVEILHELQEAERSILRAQQSGVPIEYLMNMQSFAMARHNIRPNGGGCPGENSTRFAFDTVSNDTGIGNEMNTDTETTTQENGACTYSGTFCYCCPYNDDGTKAPKPKTVTAYRNSQGVAVCQRTGCGATLKGNIVTYKGGIWEKAQAVKPSKELKGSAILELATKPKVKSDGTKERTNNN